MASSNLLYGLIEYPPSSGNMPYIDTFVEFYRHFYKPLNFLLYSVVECLFSRKITPALHKKSIARDTTIKTRASEHFHNTHEQVLDKRKPEDSSGLSAVALAKVGTPLV